jgi:hypothetical protein
MHRFIEEEGLVHESFWTRFRRWAGFAPR